MLLYFDSLLKQETKGVYGGRRNQKTEKAAHIMDTCIYDTDLHNFFDALLRDGMNTSCRHRKQDGGIQLAYRPAGWSNYTTNNGWKGHFDKTGCGFSLLVGVCIKAPTE